MYGVNGHTLKTERKGVGGDRGGRPARERERERELELENFILQGL